MGLLSHTFLFQSRNRESSNFNWEVYDFRLEVIFSFNLVVENLLISTSIRSTTIASRLSFQSRNRESSNFNRQSLSGMAVKLSCFNLVIENLLISTEENLALLYSPNLSFNLVIENLLISTIFIWYRSCLGIRFQSRNRESSNFNGNTEPIAFKRTGVSIS